MGVFQTGGGADLNGDIGAELLDESQRLPLLYSGTLHRACHLLAALRWILDLICLELGFLECESVPETSLKFLYSLRCQVCFNVCIILHFVGQYRAEFQARSCNKREETYCWSDLPLLQHWPCQSSCPSCTCLSSEFPPAHLQAQMEVCKLNCSCS